MWHSKIVAWPAIVQGQGQGLIHSWIYDGKQIFGTLWISKFFCDKSTNIAVMWIHIAICMIVCDFYSNFNVVASKA